MLCLFTGVAMEQAQTTIKKDAIYVTGEVEDNYKKDIGSKLLSSITRSQRFTVVERTDAFLSTLEDEYGKRVSGDVMDDQIAKLGQQFGARIANGGQSSNSSQTTIQSGRDFVETTAGLNLKMVWVEGGKFLMGVTDLELSPHLKSEIRYIGLDSYYIGECEITQAQWEKVMGTSIHQQADKAYSTYRNKWARPDCGFIGIGPDYPMYFISWEDAQAFCRELSRMTGRTYCLPTEAQWEYAARGGKKAGVDRLLFEYSGSRSIDAVAWYIGNSGSHAHPVKNKQANSLGLYDMSGNVQEWCSDWRYHNPTKPSSELHRVIRGGNWSCNAEYCSVACRYGLSPDSRYVVNGFRVVVLP